jgi:hypothetical protein
MQTLKGSQKAVSVQTAPDFSTVRIFEPRHAPDCIFTPVTAAYGTPLHLPKPPDTFTELFQDSSDLTTTGLPVIFFNGMVDDVRVYDRALSAPEVWQLYQQGLD